MSTSIDSRGTVHTSIETFTGKMIDLLHPSVNDICIEDIAHHLSLINRYNGASTYPISVALHSVNVALALPADNLNLRRWGLLHDAHEAYCHDITRPMKRAMEEREGFEVYRYIAATFDNLIVWRFQLEPLSSAERTKLAYMDSAVCRTEAEMASRSGGVDWDWGDVRPVLGANCHAMEWFEARRLFHKEFQKLWPAPY